MGNTLKVFISATTADLESWRLQVRDVLLCNENIRPVLKNHFSPDYRTVTERLRSEIDQCDAVIHIIGDCYGTEPKKRPADTPRRSYTQLEADIAHELEKKTFIFLLDENFPYDKHKPEQPEYSELQKAYRTDVSNSDKCYIPCYTPNDLLTHIAILGAKLTSDIPPSVSSTKKTKVTYLFILLFLVSLLTGIWMWHNQNNRLRLGTAATLTALEQVINQASEAKADQLAQNFWQQGKLKQQQGQEQFEEKDYFSAKSTWEESKILFVQAIFEAKLVTAYHQAKRSYEAVLSKIDQDLLNIYGGPKWEEVQKQIKLGDESVSDPLNGRKYYEAGEGLLADAEKEAVEKKNALIFAYQQAKLSFETALSRVDLNVLKEHGGLKWQNAQTQAKLAKDSLLYPAEGQKYYANATQLLLEAQKDAQATKIPVVDVNNVAPIEFKVQVSTTDKKQAYADGEKITFNLEASRDCYITFYTVDPDDTMTLLLPNKKQSSPLLKKGQVIMFPDRNVGFEFTISPPFGKTIIRAIATIEPFPELDTETMTTPKMIENALQKRFKPTEWTAAELVLTTTPKPVKEI